MAYDQTENALVAARMVPQLAERGDYPLEQGAVHRTLGQVYEVDGNRSEADAAFRRSLEDLGNIQSRPELAQTLLVYGRFKGGEDAVARNRFLNQALELF